jgi:hypothetical protein
LEPATRIVWPPAVVAITVADPAAGVAVGFATGVEVAPATLWLPYAPAVELAVLLHAPTIAATARRPAAIRMVVFVSIGLFI